MAPTEAFGCRWRWRRSPPPPLLPSPPLLLLAAAATLALAQDEVYTVEGLDKKWDFSGDSLAKKPVARLQQTTASLSAKLSGQPAFTIDFVRGGCSEEFAVLLAAAVIGMAGFRATK